MTTQQFSLAQMLTVTTDFLLLEEGVGKLYEILNFMTGDDLYTYALPRAADEAKPYLFEQYPFLRDISFEDLRGKGWTVMKARLDELTARHGNSFAVRPMHFEDHEVIDPFTELRRMNPNTEIITLNTGDDDDVS